MNKELMAEIKKNAEISRKKEEKERIRIEHSRKTF